MLHYNLGLPHTFKGQATVEAGKHNKKMDFESDTKLSQVELATAGHCSPSEQAFTSPPPRQHESHLSLAPALCPGMSNFITMNFSPALKKEDAQICMVALSVAETS